MKFCKSQSLKYYLKQIAQLLCVLFVFAGCQAQSPAVNQPVQTQNETGYKNIIFVGNKKLNVEIVNSPEAMAKGLSGRNKLTDEEGMLFDFTNNLSASLSSEGEGVKPSFWMKDMKFDLDLIWIKKIPGADSGYSIVSITPNVPAPKSGSDDLPTYAPPEAVNMVLEVNAGWSERNGVKVGDRVIDKN